MDSLSFRHLMYFMLPRSIYVLLKINWIFFVLFEVILYVLGTA
jgi:hypothetical protein